MVIRTERGGQFTLVGYGLMLLLIVAEIGAWVGGNRETVEHIVVDTRCVLCFFICIGLFVCLD